MSNDAKSHVTREKVPAAEDHSTLAIFGTQGARKVGDDRYHLCRFDDNGVTATDCALRGGDVAVDSRDHWWWLPQYHVGENKQMGESVPVVCFLVINKIDGVKTYKEYTGQSGVYTCPEGARVNFKKDPKIIWVEGKRRLKSIVEAEDPVLATAQKLCKHFNGGEGKMKKLAYYASRGASIAVPLALSGLTA